VKYDLVDLFVVSNIFPDLSLFLLHWII